MHPAPSIILFTVLSGFGFGALFFLGLGVSPASGLNAFWLFALAGGSAVIGLLASTLHLGHPERFLKAFTQWRSSWLSREGWLAVVTLGLAAVYGGGIVFLDARFEVVGLLLSASAVLTVFATSMIYAQLKTVPRWHDPATPVAFLASAIVGGAFVIPSINVTWLLLLFGVLQIGVWLRGSGRFENAASTTGSATGLGSRGAVRAFEPPHTGTNYLLTEMVHVVGRRNAKVLKVIALVLAVLVPVVILFISDAVAARALALAVHIIGMLSIRWLFFAEAEHVVGLYYGKR